MSTAENVETAPGPVGSKVGWVFLSITRISIGFYFLWAFIDKLIGLGFSTCRERVEGAWVAGGAVDVGCDAAWISGGRVTQGYLGSSSGPLADFFINLGDYAWTDWIFMAGLFGVGLSLILGIGTRVGMWAGVAMLTMMYVSHAWPGQVSSNPLVDSHWIEAVAIIAIVQLELSHQAIGLGKWWRKLPIVQKNRWLI